MTVRGLVGLGTTFERYNGATWDELAGIDNISGPNLSADMEEITALDSTDGWEEYIAAVLRSGEITLALNFVPGLAGHTQLIEDMTDVDEVKFKIVFPDDAVSPTTWEFDALVTGFVPTTTVGKITANVTFKPTGVPDLDLGP